MYVEDIYKSINLMLMIGNDLWILNLLYNHYNICQGVKNRTKDSDWYSSKMEKQV